MVYMCAVVGCKSKSGQKNVSMHRIPSIKLCRSRKKVKLSMKRRKKWIGALKRKDLNDAMLKYMKICGNHFIIGKPAKTHDVHNPDWVPSLMLDVESDIASNPVLDPDDINSSPETLSATEGGSDTLTADTVTSNTVSLDKLSSETLSAEENRESQHFADGLPVSMVLSFDCESQTDLTGDDIKDLNHEVCSLRNDVKSLKMDLESLQLEVQTLHEEKYYLRDKVNKLLITQESFKGNDAKTKYFTGLPTFTVLMTVYDLVFPFIKQHPKNPMNTFQCLILTLMRLRLNLPFKDLAYRFNVSPTTASSIFFSCLNVLYCRLKDFVKWPSREELVCITPAPFQDTFGNKVTVIIDCFEIPIEKPSNLSASAQCYSHYKQRHTVKYLIGITPQGAVCFISDGWGGRTSDKYLTENSRFLDNLLPGDVVLADRGFTIQESVGMYCAKLVIPAFTRGKKQLSAFEIEKTRQVAHVRIHVERVIGIIRQKFRILHEVIPISLLVKVGDVAPLDKIVTVCCALANLCPSVVISL